MDTGFYSGKIVLNIYAASEFADSGAVWICKRKMGKNGECVLWIRMPT